MSWTIDPSHTRAVFSVRHLMIARVHGQFEKVDGTVDFNADNPTLSSADVRIDATSITTRDPNRDAHLKSPDFLDAERYPYLYFKSQRMEMVDESHARLVGDMTIRDVTRPITFDVEYNGTVKNPWGKTVAGFTASTKINRKDWGLNWNVALETGGWLVDDIINIDLELEIVEQPEAVPA
jgi:polyisoprenoid-binding protein YceI